MSKRKNLNNCFAMSVFLLVIVGPALAELLCPFQVGQRYELRRTDNDGNEWTVRGEINGQMTNNSSKYFYVQVWNYDNDSTFRDLGFLRSTENELYVYNPDGEDYLEFQKAPVGTKWSYYREYGDGLNYTVTEIVDINTPENPVVVPYGTFDEAYVYRKYQCVNKYGQGKSPDWYNWAVPGIGYVKEVDYWNANPPMIEELVGVYDCDFDSNSAVITNPWLGLIDIGDSYRLAGYGSFAGSTRVYALTEHPLTGTENVLGVECLILTIWGHGNNSVTEYYQVRIAQDTCGNIRVLRVTGRDESGPVYWEAKSPSEAPIFLPSDPCVEQRFSCYVAGEYYEVIALDQTVSQMSTGLGPYTGCMHYRLNSVYNTNTDDKWFCPDIGVVKEDWNDRGINGWERTTQSPISNHLYSIGIHQGWDYQYPGEDLIYEFTFRVQSDASVTLVEFLTPAGHTFGVPKIAENGGIAYWEYYVSFSVERGLEEYGDGTYTITVHYQDDTNDQTTAWFGIPATSETIPQITQEPVLTFPKHNDTTISPLTFVWESCTDSNANVIVLALVNHETGKQVFHILPLLPFLPQDANSWDNTELSEGLWEAGLSFGQRYLPVPNNDGILVGVSKYSESDYTFTINE